MNAPSKKPQAAETVADVIEKMDAQRANNLRLWNVLSKTDPQATKGFKRAGGFSGTAIKPIWITQRLTELFGPAGVGWGTGEPQFTTVVGQDGEVLVYCTVVGWYREASAEAGKVAQVYGVGGDKAVAWVGRDNQRRMVTDDEAFKKAFTDAIGNAFKFVGVAADVHMGLFDDSKYVQEMAAEFHPPNPTTGEPKKGAPVKLDGPYTCPTQLRTAAKEFVRTLESMGDLDEFIAWSETQDYREFVEQLARDMPSWWETGEGLPEEFVPLEIRVRQRREDLERTEATKTRETA
jgi:hypothetical protein